ncbi:sugar ABC transporter permease [Candidatus Sumerlaeota bacterium]|nr:sugar ABC transporter permease [Candidatus Sumerlaeota bacterium]
MSLRRHLHKWYEFISRREIFTGYLFASPWILGFFAFTLIPIILSFYYSFCRYDVLRPPMFVGFQNYYYLLFKSEKFYTSVYNTLYFTVFRVPLVMIGSLLLALLVATPRRGVSLARTIYYMPSIITGVALSVIWLWMYNPKYGLINRALALLGLPLPLWLESPTWAKPAIILMGIWSIGGGRMIVMIAGLNSIPRHLYESARVDGAGWWSQFWHITIPQLSPTLFLLTVVEVIFSFQVFTEAYIMTRGGPLDSTLFYNLELYFKAFLDYRMGEASALAWLLFVGTCIITLLMFWILGRRVYYEAERR